MRRPTPFTFILYTITACSLFATGPLWWSERGVIDTTATDNDHAPANIGQAKNMVEHGIAELNEKLDSMGGAGFEFDAILNPSASNDFAPLNIGQLKYVASFFYQRFEEIGFTEPPVNPANPHGYPWPASTATDNDFAPANVGQLKYLFSWDLSNWLLPTFTDSDGDRLDDNWEINYFGSIDVHNDVNDDSDGDGLNLRIEYLAQTSPLVNDSSTWSNHLLFNLDLQAALANGGEGDVVLMLPGLGACLIDEKSETSTLTPF